MSSRYPHSVNIPGEPLIGFVRFEEDFVGGPVSSATDDAAKFDLVGTSAGLVLADDEQNGVGTLTSNSTNPAFLVQNGEPFGLASKRRLRFDARVNLTDADGMSFFCGLAITSANPFSSSLSDYIGFFATDGNIKIGCGKDNNSTPGAGTSGETDTDSGKDFADDTWVRLTFEVFGTDYVEFYVDGTYVGRVSTNLPNNENLCATVGMVGSGETIDIDYVVVESERNTAA